MRYRGQISFEYLIVVSFVVFIVLIILSLALFYVTSSRDQIKINQLVTFSNKIVSSAESVYYAGEPSKVTITVYLPEGVQSIQILENSLVFDILTSTGSTIIAFPSNVPLDPTLDITFNEGLKRLTISADTNAVHIVSS
ncbi:MAG: hypothetical protein ACP5NS_03685 [Candidatus Pacearchaeota archaeon]